MPQPAIIQSMRFDCPPSTLFALYADSAKHTASTGARAKISRKVGGKFTAFEGALSGTNLLIIPNQMIVQAWRSTGWKKNDLDSILVLQFSKAPGGSQADLVHINVPPQDHAGVTKGWHKYYWEPWKKYLAAKKSKAKKRKS